MHKKYVTGLYLCNNQLFMVKNFKCNSPRHDLPVSQAKYYLQEVFLDFFSPRKTQNDPKQPVALIHVLFKSILHLSTYMSFIKVQQRSSGKMLKKLLAKKLESCHLFFFVFYVLLFNLARFDVTYVTRTVMPYKQFVLYMYLV